jgi:hypothetical protein
MTLASDLVVYNITLIVIFFGIYSYLYTINKNNFKGAHNYIDILFLTTSTQSSIGYGDVAPNSNIAKLISSLHHILILFVMAHFIYRLSKIHFPISP